MDIDKETFVQEQTRIIADTEAILQQLHGRVPLAIVWEPINWTNLHAIQANWVFYPATHWQVVISQADPDAQCLSAYIAEKLAERGYPDVKVITEW